MKLNKTQQAGGQTATTTVTVQRATIFFSLIIIFSVTDFYGHFAHVPRKREREQTKREGKRRKQREKENRVVKLVQQWQQCNRSV